MDLEIRDERHDALAGSMTPPWRREGDYPKSKLTYFNDQPINHRPAGFFDFQIYNALEPLEQTLQLA
jgi:hypothetical protein